MSYIGNGLTDVQVNRYEYTATAGQTTFNASYDHAVDVYLNGVRLAESDFTATTGTSITLASGATAGDIVTIAAYYDITNGDIDAVAPAQSGNAGKFLTTDGTNASWQPLSKHRNLIINGAMQVWQRSTSASLSGNASYATVDRFMFWMGGGTGTSSKQTDVLNGESFNYLRVVNDGNGTNSNTVFLRQRLEDLAFLGGKTTTLSFRAKASSTMSINFYQRHSYGSGGSATEDIEGTESVTLSTSWQEFSVTLPAWNTMSGKTIGTGAFAMLGFQADTTSAWTIDITNIQLEVGSVATPFEHRSYGEELALCQRYYTTTNSTFDGGYQRRYTNVASGINAQGHATFPVTMRAVPTRTDLSTYTLDQATGANYIVSPKGYNRICSSGAAITYYGTNNVTFAWDAEL